MNKITSEHLARDAYVYVRQSTPHQLLNTPERRRRQYALETRARSLGWENVIVIDEDLGRSGGGAARPGFERLLASICAGTAGAVLAIEASRLARNGRDWHTLLEFCVVVNSLIIDEDGIYDPRSVNDRLLLGVKGTFSELELAMFRQRSREALRLKAARGELNTTVAIGYRRGADDRLEQDPDKRIRVRIGAVSAPKSGRLLTRCCNGFRSEPTPSKAATAPRLAWADSGRGYVRRGAESEGSRGAI